MTNRELMELRASNDAPFNHSDYTIWLHEQILTKIRQELWEFRENESTKIKSSYAACNYIMSLPSLKIEK